MKKIFNIDEIRYDFVMEKIILRGWIITDKNKELLIYIDDKKYKRIKLENIRKDVNKHYEGELKNNESGYEIYLEIEQTNIENINLVMYEKDEVIFSEKIKINKEELLKNKTISYSIDSVEKKGKNLIIKGWAFSKLGGIVSIKCNGENELTRYTRHDVFNILDECRDSKNIGFDIVLKKIKRKKIQIEFSDKNSIIIENLNPRVYKLKKIKRKIKMINEVKKEINIPNIKRSLRYIKNNGLFSFFYMVKLRIKNVRKEDIYYDEWFKNNEISKIEEERQRNYKFDYNPKITIVVPTYNTPKNFLIEMLDSVIYQTYSNWELCIADGASQKKETLEILREYEKKDERIKIKYLNENYKISGNTNKALEIASGDYIGLFDHDDLLTKDALFEVVKAINENEFPDFIYTDEDKTDENTKRFFDPYFKPDYSIHTLRSNNYICHFSVFKREMIDKVGKFRSEYDGAQDYDIILRITEQANKIIHIPKVLYHWRVHQNSTAGSSSSKSYTVEAGRKAVEAHIKRLGIQAEVIEDFSDNFYKVKYELKDEPVVSIVIANKDHKEDLERCLNSLKKTTYNNYEIIVVENNSIINEIFEYYDEISKEKNIKVVKWDGKGFNYSAINNFGVKNAIGKYVVFLNNDTELITKDWLEELIGVIQIESVGIVGTKLYYPDNTIQHAGVILGMEKVAGHIYKGYSRNDFGPFGRLKIRQNMSAVTAAAMIIKREIFEKVGGFDEIDFKVAFNDIDLCRKITSEGYDIVWIPYVEMYHYESKSRGFEDTPEKKKRFKIEIDKFDKKWGLWNKDPFYNENLDLTVNYPRVKREGRNTNYGKK